MTATSLTFKPTHYIDAEKSRFERVIAALRHWDDINSGHQMEKRTSDRLAFFGSPILEVELPQRPGESTMVTTQTVSFDVWGRDLSRGGLSFLTSREILPVLASDTTPIVRVEDEILRFSQSLLVGLRQFSDSDDGILWVESQLVRFRRIQEELIECGVRFLRKLEPLPK